MESRRKANDISPLLAAVLLVAIVAILSFSHVGNFQDLEENLDAGLADYGILIMGTVMVAFLNILAIQSYLLKSWSYRKQGSRLRDLMGERGGSSLKISRYGGLFLAIAAVLIILLFRAETVIGIRIIPESMPTPIRLGIILNGILGTAIIGHGISKIWERMRSASIRNHGIRQFPIIANSLVLGAESSPEISTDEDWVMLGKKALCGNILITGSIGSGKTQGTILPYFDQLMGSFEPKPAVLAIDPKGTFIKEAISIAGRHGRAGDVRHLRLGGDVSFNPIYVEGVLKMGKFFDVAQMIRAAAINYSGRGSADSPFWELSAFNLTKNAIVYCAVVHDYYTLNDLYAAMVDAVEDRAQGMLEAAIPERNLEPEEEHNARQALNYFSQEFHSFDQKLRTGILATATSFLNQFQEFQASLIFCPTKEARTLKSIDEVVDGGQILCFDIDSPGLAKAMGTFIKLHYQQSVLQRLTVPSRSKERPALLIIDEYQDVVSTGHGMAAGDDRFLAKGREANAISICATQSLSSIENSLGRSDAAKELCQNFRTRIACHSTDLLTIRTFQDLIGEEERQKRSHSYSELSQDTRKNYVMGGFESDNANISESISTSMQREPIITGKDFSRLSSFEALSLVYDGVKTRFIRLNLKPFFLKDRAVKHVELLRSLTATIVCTYLVFTPPAGAFPNLCDVINQASYPTCLDYQASACTCPGLPPRPCTRISFYLPDRFIEVTGERATSKFRGLPGAEAQLNSVAFTQLPFGTEGDDFSAYQARTIPVPFMDLVSGTLSCGARVQETTCFSAMSEHLGGQWSTGSADRLQPNFLAWLAQPKACLLAGAVRSVTGGGEPSLPAGAISCSTPRPWLTQYPPSSHSACSGWGTFYPRVGLYDGPSQTTGALMVAARMNSLSAEVFQGGAVSADEKWQMISPTGSQCFREGQNSGVLETGLQVNDLGRLRGRPKDYLFVTWRHVSCCRDIVEVPAITALMQSLKSVCRGMGGMQ